MADDNVTLPDATSNDDGWVTADAPSTRPAWLPEGIDTPEQLAEKYAALVAGPGDDVADDDIPDADDVDDTADEADDDDDDDDSGIDYMDLGRKLVENGELDEEDYVKLEAEGISRELVDTYYEGQKALEQGILNEVYGTFGGEAQYQEVVQWAAQNMKPAQIAVINDAIDSGNMDTISMAMTSLQAAHAKANPKGPRFVAGGTSSRTPAAGSTFTTVAQVTEAMNDPRYAKDEGYRNSVAARLRNSGLF